MTDAKRILLIDADDDRRSSRVLLLASAGYAVEIRDDYTSAELLDHEGGFDLVILALHGRPDRAIAYSDELSRAKPKLPILLLTDFGVYVPRGTLSRAVETGNPAELMQRIAAQLDESSHVRELPLPV